MSWRATFLLMGFGVVFSPGTVRAQNPASPAPRPDAWWTQRHEERLALSQRFGEFDAVVVGDSITQGWDRNSDLWAREFPGRRMLNLGFSGDSTHHVLWRLSVGGELSCLRHPPRAVWVLIGTNNLEQHTVRQTLTGIFAVVKRVELDTGGKSAIWVQGLLPRGKTAADPLRVKARAVNVALSAALARSPRPGVRHVEFWDEFLEADGSVRPGLMEERDHPLHLTRAGYEKWMGLIAPRLRER